MDRDEPVAGGRLQLLVGAPNQRPKAHNDTIDVIDGADVSRIKLADFAEPCAGEQCEKWHPEPRVARSLGASLIVATLPIDAAAIERRVQNGMKLLAVERQALITLVDRVRQAQPARRGCV